MKSNVKYMLLGIAVMILGIYLRVIYIGYISNSFVRTIWFVLPIIGFLVVLFAFLFPDHHEDIADKTYDILFEQKEKSIKETVCPKCGKAYKEIYTSCPWCGYKEK